MDPNRLGPIKTKMNNAKEELKLIKPEEKHWFCGGDRSIVMAATLLQQSKIIALPTDTIYGLAGLASDWQAIQRLYKIKKRNDNNPLAICLSNVRDVKIWAVTDNIPVNLLESLLPGPYTIILPRRPILNPALNPGTDSVGIRVPNSKFIRSVASIVGPLALTSANISSEPSTLYVDEFSTLWPELDGIFHDIPNTSKISDKRRIGSTVVDLSQSGYYKIIRVGIGANIIIGTLNKSGLKKISEE